MCITFKSFLLFVWNTVVYLHRRCYETLPLDITYKLIQTIEPVNDTKNRDKMTTLNQLPAVTKNSIVEHAISQIENREGVNGCDLHNALFNEDYFIIGRYQAEQWLIDNGGVFNAIGEIQEYEKEQFGETNTDCSEPEKVANMYAYILGEIILGECATINANWDNQLTEDDIQTIIGELKNI